MALKKTELTAFWGEDSMPNSPCVPYKVKPDAHAWGDASDCSFTPPSDVCCACKKAQIKDAEIPSGMSEAAFWGCEEFFPDGAPELADDFGSPRARHTPDEALSQASTLDGSQRALVLNWLASSPPPPSPEKPHAPARWGHGDAAQRSPGCATPEVEQDTMTPRAALPLRRRHRFHWGGSTQGAGADGAPLLDTPDVDVASGVWGLIRTPRVRELQERLLRVGRKATVQSRVALYFMPEGLLRRTWDFLGLFLVCLLLGVQVVNARWVQQHSSWLFADIRAANPHATILIKIKVLLEFFFMADIFVKLRTAYFDEKGHLVTDKWRMARKYATNWLVCDIFCALPLELLDMTPDPVLVNRRLANHW
ncbi:hypothetical protein T484DRAFT_3097884 [Baffinella frigidus]|nr:hypothetical protein T484DRAFT_3097884 [Cryptophyta sp. CCMP2293]